MVARASGSGEQHYVTQHEVDAAARHLEGKPRARALVRFLWVTGARVSEALRLQVKQLDFRAKTAKLQTLKRRARMFRTLPLPGDVLGDLAMLINLHKLGGEDRVFGWSRQRAFELVRDAFLAVGVERERCHPHALRHGHAHHAIRSGVPLNAIQAQLGHASIVTTSTYLAATGEDLRREYSKVSW
jgi:integrase/recombinase XerD